MSKKKETAAERLARLQWYEAILGKNDGFCWGREIITHRCDGPKDPMHFIPKQFLKREANLLPINERVALVWDVRNGMPGCRWFHNRMDLGLLRVYRGQLPAEVVEFATEHDLLWKLDKHFPEGDPA